MKLTLNDGFLDDWWLIERAEHDGRKWLERTGPRGMALMCSARISDADVEGSGAEMLEIATAIREGRGAHFRRCAVEPVDGGFVFCSPRNSTRDSDVVSRADALALADEIEATVRAAQAKETP